jgi:hypothetical protein
MRSAQPRKAAFVDALQIAALVGTGVVLAACLLAGRVLRSGNGKAKSPSGGITTGE